MKKVKKCLRLAIFLPIVALVPLLIGQQPLSDAQLRQIIANWLGYPIDQLQFENRGIQSSSLFVFSTNDPIQQSEYQVQEYEVALPNNMVYYVTIDRYNGFIYNAGNIIQIPNLTLDRMLSPEHAITLARQYLQRYYIWSDTSTWGVTRIVPEVVNGQWTQAQPMISVGFEPPLQIPQLPEGVGFINEAIGCSITIDAVRGDFVGFYASYSQIDFPLEPLITSEEAEALARQYLVSKGKQVEGTGHWTSLVLAPELGTTYARLAYMFGFHCPVGDNLYMAAWIGVDAHTGEIVYAEIPF